MTREKWIEEMNGGRFVSHHSPSVNVYYDSRHRCIKCRMSGGGYCELIQEYPPLGGPPRSQLLLTVNAKGERSVIEYPMPRLTHESPASFPH